MGPMILIGESKVYKHGKAKTLYLSIPSKVAQDSAFTIREGDTVVVRFDEDQNAVIIQTTGTQGKKQVKKGGI